MKLSSFAVEMLETRRLLSVVPSGFIDQAFGGTFGAGTAMEFAPDGRLFVLTQTGSVRIIDTGGNLLPTPAASLTVDSFFERGLLGIAFDPNFATNNYVYLYYTIPSSQGGPINNISRFVVSGNTIDTNSRAEIWRFNTLSAGNHNGGALHFGPDGMLYAAHGENAVSSNAQSIANMLGKVIRIDPSQYTPGNQAAVIPADNPTSFPGIAGTTSGLNRAIWAVGLRNTFTFSFEPGTGRLLLNDVGQNTWEEVNVGQAGRNYGWPTTEGDFNQASFPNFTRPIFSYQHGSGTTRGNAISGGAIYKTNAASQFPPQYQNKYFFGDYVNNWIGYIDPNTPPAANAHTNFATGATGIVDVKLGPDGYLYYLLGGASGNGVRRVRPDPTQSPAIIDQPDNATVFNGDGASFTVVAGGAGTLSYQWTRNGVDISGANGPTYVLPNAQASDSGAVFRVRVTNAIGTALSNGATLQVIVNAAPVPQITSPGSGTLYTAGDTINFAGGATDTEDGVLGATNLEWEVQFHHDTHTHPFFPPTSGISSGQFTIPQVGETSANVFYRIRLTATDSLGRTGTTFLDVTPRTANLQIAANVSGLTLNLDGQPQTAPYSFAGVAGVIRNIAAPASQVLAGQTYQFQNWSDGGAATHDITTPLTDTTYTANYADITLPEVTGSLFTYAPSLPAPPHALTFDFSENVSASLTLSDVVITRLDDNSTVDSGTMALAYSDNKNRATITFPGQPNGQLPDGNYRATIAAGAVTDSFGNPTAAATNADFFVLLSDADHSRVVNLTDFTILAANFGQSSRIYSQGDFNYDGLVQLTDFTILASRFGNSLPAARAASSALPPRFSSSPISPAWNGAEDKLIDVIV